MQANKEFNLKLIKILDQLEEDKKEFKLLEGSVNDQELKQILLQLIRNEEEYAKQLLLNFSDGRLTDDGIRMPKAINEKELREIKFTCKEELFEKCKRKQMAIEKIYRDAIDSCKFEKKLKGLMQNQLNGLKVLFLKIRINYMVKSRLLNPYDLRKEYSYKPRY